MHKKAAALRVLAGWIFASIKNYTYSIIENPGNFKNLEAIEIGRLIIALNERHCLITRLTLLMGQPQGF